MISWSYHRGRLIQQQSDWIVDWDEIGCFMHSIDLIDWVDQGLPHIGCDRQAHNNMLLFEGVRDTFKLVW